MRLKALIMTLISAVLVVLFIIYSQRGIDGALKGIAVSYNIIIPSLFPITVFSIIIFETGVLQKLRMNNLSVFVMSLLGGFPVGAKIIEKEYSNSNLTKKNAEIMLCYCVNSAPSFAIISVGLGILKDIRLGYILFSANLMSSILLAILLRCLKEKDKEIKNNLEQKDFSEIFTNSTYEATKSVLGICGIIVLFSAVIEILNSFSENFKTILSPLEITNGIILAERNLYLIAFLIGFSGFCVHFQVFSICKGIKPRYFPFFMVRILHGILMMLFTKLLINIFDISVQTLTTNIEYIFKFSEISIVFGVLFILLSVMFIVSVSKENNKV